MPAQASSTNLFSHRARAIARGSGVISYVALYGQLDPRTLSQNGVHLEVRPIAVTFSLCNMCALFQHHLYRFCGAMCVLLLLFYALFMGPLMSCFSWMYALCWIYALLLLDLCFILGGFVAYHFGEAATEKRRKGSKKAYITTRQGINPPKGHCTPPNSKT